MAVKDTSRKAHKELADSGYMSTQQRDVIKTIGRRRMTRAEIAERSGIRLSSVCGRVNDLVAAGMLEVAEKSPCSITGKTAEHLAMTDKARIALWAYMSAKAGEVA